MNFKRSITKRICINARRFLLNSERTRENVSKLYDVALNKDITNEFSVALFVTRGF